VCGQVVLLAQQHAQAAAAGITCDAGTIDAAADHQQVDFVHGIHGVPWSGFCRAEPCSAAWCNSRAWLDST